MTPSLRHALAALCVLGGLAASAPTAPAAAGVPMPDNCGDLDLTDLAAVAGRGALADDVFVGRVDRVQSERGAGDDPTAGSGDAAGEATSEAPRRTLLHRVEVVEPLAGDLSAGALVPVVLVAADADPAAEQRQLGVGTRYVFFTTDGSAALQADACDGWAPAEGLDASGLADLAEALAPPEEEPAQVALREPSGGAPGAPELGRVVAPGAAIGLVGVLGLVLVSRLGRRRS